MKRTLVIGRAFEAVAMLVLLVFVSSQRISGKAVYDRIQLGMTDEQVYAILPRNKVEGLQNDVIGVVAPFDQENMLSEGGTTWNMKKNKCWQIDNAHVFVNYDDNDRVFGKSFMPLQLPKTPWFDKVKAWLGL